MAARRAFADRLAERPAAGLAVTCGVTLFVIGALVGPQVLLHPGHSAVGLNPDSDFQIMTWSLEWWPWAIRHGADPLHTQLLWPPDGFSTLWMTTIPFPALAGLPITLTAGPLVAYNVLIILAAPLATGAAYLLCHELTGRFGPSFVGGLLFGLSPFMLGHTLSQHLNLAFVFPVPLLVLLAVRYARGKTSTRRFFLGFAALLLLQVGSSLELFVDVTLFLALGFAIALIGAGAWRDTVLRTGARIGLAYLVCLPVLVAIAALAMSAPHGHLRYPASQFPIDLLNLVVPTRSVLAGAAAPARSVSEHFSGNIGEQDGYLGIPLLIVALFALRTEWRRGAWLAGGLFFAALLLSFGPVLNVGGRALVSLPFALSRLPIVGYALPARLSIFTSLAAACLCALWLARPQRATLRVAVAALILLSLLPNFATARFRGRWAGPTDLAGNDTEYGWRTNRVPRGFAAGRAWRRVVKPGSNVLVLPSGDQAPAEYWQARSGMRFALAVPATPFTPPKIATAPVSAAVLGNSLPLTAGPHLGAARLRSYLLADRVRAVVLTRDAILAWGELVSNATATGPILLGDTSVYRVAPRLRPLTASGSIAVAKTSRSVLTAWVYFDGRHSHVRARLRSARGQSDRSVTLSSPDGDADAPFATADSLGHAAVGFTEWHGGKASVRVATVSAGRWRVASLERGNVSSPKVAVTRNGTTAAAWTADAGTAHSVRAAVLSPSGTWQAPVTLEKGNGIRLSALSPGRGSGAVCAWHDTAGTEGRIRAATYGGGAWSPVDTVGSSSERIPIIALAGPDATRLEWTVWYPDKRLAFFQARRKGSSWVRPSGPVRIEPRYDPPVSIGP